MRAKLNALAVLLLVHAAHVVAGEPIRGVVSLPATGIPGEGPCGPISDVTSTALRKATTLISNYTRGVVPAEIVEGLVFSSGVVKAEHSACQQVCIVAPEKFHIWFESPRSGNHPWWCGGRRQQIDFQYSRVFNVSSRRVASGYYLICGTFQNWSHNQALEAAIVAYPPGMAWLWPGDRCGLQSQNTPFAAHVRPLGEADFDSDKQLDIYQVEDGVLMVHLSKTLRTVQVPNNIPDYNPNLGFWLVGDFNADGSADLLHMVTKDAAGGPLDYCDIHFSYAGGKFRQPTAPFHFPCAANPQCDYNTSLGTWAAADINSDGRTDLVHDPRLPKARRHCWFAQSNGRFQLRDCGNL